jgi:hypothetical protein
MDEASAIARNIGQNSDVTTRRMDVASVSVRSIGPYSLRDNVRNGRSFCECEKHRPEQLCNNVRKNLPNKALELLLIKAFGKQISNLVFGRTIVPRYNFIDS